MKKSEKNKKKIFLKFKMWEVFQMFKKETKLIILGASFTLKGVFAKNERGHRLNAIKKRFCY